jgi:cyclic beta-1,2-glucan synthetase
MQHATSMLVDDKLKIVKLFTPPFSKTEKDPGYIKSYPPGVRENGGQYTHAATWFVIALAEMGLHDEAYRCLSMLNPVNHATDEASAELYRVEPYVVAADIYAEDNSTSHKGGRGGWTWYTGSAGWLYRAAVESVLGIERRGNRVQFNPKLPSHWDGYSASLKMLGAELKVRVTRDKKALAMSIELNGVVSEGSAVDLKSGEIADVLIRIPG